MATATIGTRRSPVEIVYDILSVCVDGGVDKTAVMYRSNLSHDQLVRYLDYLTGQGFLEHTGKRFQVSSAGREMLDEISQVIDLLRGLRGDEAV